MNTNSEDYDSTAIQQVIRIARIQRDAAMGDLIGGACAATLHAIAVAASRLRALVMGRAHA